MDTNGGKTICFIDHSNIFRNSHSRDGFKIDYKKLISKFEDLRGEIFDTWMFGSIDPSNQAQVDFYKVIRDELKFNVVIKPLKRTTKKCRECGEINTNKMEKGVDVALASRMLLMMNHYDTAILVSGDGDYNDIAIELVRAGKRVEVASFRDSLSNDLKNSVKSIIYLDDFLDDIKRDF